MFFDYMGVTRDQNGKALSSEGPENKLIELPVLIREKAPIPIKIESITVDKKNAI